MRRFLRNLWLAVLVLALVQPSLPNAFAQNPGDAGKALDAVTYDLEDIRERVEDGRLSEAEAEQLISEIANLQSLAGELARKSLRKPQLASLSNQLTQVLTNFDIWVCGTTVLAWGLQHRQLVVEAARAQPADPELDRAVADLGELIARLQEACNRYVYDAGLTGAEGAAAMASGPDEEPAVEEPPQPTTPVQERICYDRCKDLYSAYHRAEREYERNRKAAEQARSSASERRRVSEEAAERARREAERVAERDREVERLQRIINDPATSEAARAAAADRYGDINSSGPAGPDFAGEAEQAAAAAREAEARADSAEARASRLYDAMIEIYRAWERCAQNCVEQAWMYEKVVVDAFRVFSSMPLSPPRRPPFYRPLPAPPVPPAARPVEQRPATSRIVTTPVALSGGMLVGAVYDDQGEPEDELRITVTSSDGERTEVTTGAGGRFALDIPAGEGELALALPGSDPTKLEVVESIPDDLTSGFPQFVELGSTISVATPYRSVSLRRGDGLAIDLASSTALGPGGTGGITSFEVPFLTGTGPVTIHAVGMDGQQTVVEAVSYGYLNAWLERDKLRSGQDAEFGFELDFGTGPMMLTGVVTTTGPIVYPRVGQPQVIEVDAQGKARLVGSIRALQGSPAGIPFTIEAVFTRAP